jgi:hypothetical protein
MAWRCPLTGGKTDIPPQGRDFRFCRSIATEIGCPCYVRVPPESDRTVDIGACHKCAMWALLRCHNLLNSIATTVCGSSNGTNCCEIANWNLLLPIIRPQDRRGGSAAFVVPAVRLRCGIWAFIRRVPILVANIARSDFHLSIGSRS